MLKQSDFPEPSDYKNYRNIRAVAILYVVLGWLILTSGVVVSMIEFKPGVEGPPGWLTYLMIALGLCGQIGGLAVLVGARRLSMVIYGIAIFYLFVFPVVTILSMVMINGLPKYLRNLRLVQEQRGP